MNFDLKEMEINSEMTLEELKIRKQKIEEINEESFKSIKKLNEILLAKLEKGDEFISVTEKTKKLKELILKLTELITEKLEISKSIEDKHQALTTLYKNVNKEEEDNRQMTVKVVSSSEEDQKELQVTQDERDKALGLIKILLATLKSSRMQSEENFHKLKHSSDLMFHIMYKAEDAFLRGDE